MLPLVSVLRGYSVLWLFHVQLLEALVATMALLEAVEKPAVVSREGKGFGQLRELVKT